MLMDCVSGFASSISRDLVCGALNQLHYPCCFNNFVEDLEKEEKNLISTRDCVQKRVADSKRQTRETAEVVVKWLQEANTDVEKVKQLLEEARTRKSCCFGHSPNWIWRYRLGKKLANKTRDLEKFIREGRNYAPFDRIITLPSGTADILSENCMNFESREFANEQLMKALKDDEVVMIGLYGMGGCGKTTLAMEARKKAEAEHLFDKVLFVPVSSTVDVRRIQEKIASSMQYPFPENEESERAQRLCMRLREENKILLILDDVWEKLDFGAIGIPSFEHHKGCKVLITTRSEEVCTSMDCQRKIFLPILNDEEAWALFQKKSLISEDTSDTIKQLARVISNECKGLPVAIAAVASSLKGKAEVIWKVALDRMRSSKPLNIEKGLINPYKCLQLSYDNLDTEEAKSLLLLCSVFPEDYEISIELLTRCAIGLGVVGEVRSYDEARSEVIATKIKLVSSCLLLDAHGKRVKMHDLVRDVAHLIAKHDNKVIKCELGKDVTLEETSIRYLWCAKYPNDLDCSNLEFLCIRIKTKLEEFDGILKRMEKLRVLILHNEQSVSLSKISFKTLKNLRFLLLRGFEMTDISFVSDMKKLQGLSLHLCSLPSIFELQTDVIVTQLPNLKLLELHECDMKRTNFDLMERIPRLEELYIIDLQGEWRASSENTIEFFNTFSVPQTLQRYGIVFESNRFYNYNTGELCSDHSTLLLPYFHISNVAIKGLAKKAKELYVANIQGGAKNIIPDIFQIEGGMNELNKLEIGDSEEIECLVDTTDHLCQVGTLFSKLHTLRICDMKHIRALWHGCLPPGGTFQKLEKLYLRDCPFLTYLFTHVIAQSLVQLKILKISGCDELKHIVADDDKTEKSEDEFKIGHHVQSPIFQNLQEVVVDTCGKLKHVFSAGIVGGLPQLKELRIEDCSDLDKIIEDIVPSAYEDKKEVDEIIWDPHVESTSVPSIVNHSSGSFTLSNLARLQIVSCPKLGSLFMASAAKTITSLENLFIWDCEGLKHIITDERVNKYQKENIVEDDDHDFQTDISMFKSLKMLNIIECDLLQHIFPVPFVGGPMKLNDQQQNNTEIELHALEQLGLRRISKSIIPDNYDVRCPSLGILSLDSEGIQEYLSLSDLPLMTNIWAASKNSFTLQRLNTLRIEGCAKLEVIFPPAVLRCLPELKLLVIKNFKELKQIINEEEVEDKNLSTLVSPKPCFPKLATLLVEQCHKLKRLFPASASASNDLPNLEVLILNRAIELEELIGCEQVKGDRIGKANVELPKLNLLIFLHLPNFRQEIEPMNVKHHIVHNCPKLSVTSTTTLRELCQNIRDDLGYTGLSHWEINDMICQINEYDEVSGSSSTSELASSQENNPIPETTPFEMNQDHPSISKTKSPSSQVNDNNQSMMGNIAEMVHENIRSGALVPEMASHLQSLEQKLLPISSSNMTKENNHILETTSFEMNQDHPSTSKTKSPSSQVNDNNQSIMGSIAEMVHEYKQIESETDKLLELEGENKMASHSQSLEQKLPPISFLNMPKLVDEESSNEAGFPDQQALVETMNIEEIGKESIQKGHPSNGAIVKSLSSGGRNIVAQDDKLNEGKTAIMSCQEIQIQEGLIGIVSENIIDVSLDTYSRLGAYKHLVDLDDAQIALLLEAITTCPHLWRACEKFSERFRALMLKTLAEILFFLRNETAVSISPQSENEFHRLCDEAVQLGFERSWVDEIRQRVVASHPELDNAQARIKELLERRNHLTQELQDIQDELKILNDFVDAQTKCFDFL